MTPDVVFHALAGAVGIASGATSLFTRKGDRVHRTAGKVFFIAMMTAAATAIWLARIFLTGWFSGRSTVAPA
jgi:uncharacterized membrane protein